MKRFSLAAAVSAIALVTAGPAAAHTQTVNPPGQDGPTVSGPISNSFAQAHCHAQAPQAVTNSGGVVTFTPIVFGPCPAVPNPGGQITGP